MKNDRNRSFMICHLRGIWKSHGNHRPSPADNVHTHRFLHKISGVHKFLKAHPQTPRLSNTTSRLRILVLEWDFSTLALLTSNVGLCFVIGGCPMQCRTLSSIPSLYSPDADNSFPPPSWQPKMSPGTAKCPPGGTQSPPNHSSRGRSKKISQNKG